MSLKVPEFDGLRVVVAGDVTLGHYWRGSASRIAREKPVPALQVRDVEDRAGGELAVPDFHPGRSTSSIVKRTLQALK